MLGREIGTAMRVVVAFDAAQDGHGIGGGGFDSVVGAAAERRCTIFMGFDEWLPLCFDRPG
jgi:hypothetical protein